MTEKSHFSSHLLLLYVLIWDLWGSRHAIVLFVVTGECHLSGIHHIQFRAFSACLEVIYMLENVQDVHI